MSFNDTREQNILDHMYCDTINKIKITVTGNYFTTDHKFTLVKQVKWNRKYYITRKWKAIDWDNIKQNILISEIYMDMIWI